MRGTAQSVLRGTTMALVSLETRRGTLAAVWQHGRWELVQCQSAKSERGGALRIEHLFVVERAASALHVRSVAAHGRLLRAMPDAAAHSFHDWTLEVR